MYSLSIGQALGSQKRYKKMKIEVSEDSIGSLIAEEIMWYHQNGMELTGKDLKALERVLAHYCTREQYNDFMGHRGAWEAVFGI
jgi:hypothetical protein